MTRRLVLSALLVLLGLLPFAGCGNEPEPTAAALLAENAWEALQKQHDASSYDLFIRTNRMAAKEHRQEHDTVGVRFQLRALEAQAAESERSSDTRTADHVQTRINEIIDGGLMEVYEDVLPGSRKRFEAARAVATRVLGE